MAKEIVESDSVWCRGCYRRWAYRCFSPSSVVWRRGYMHWSYKLRRFTQDGRAEGVCNSCMEGRRQRTVEARRRWKLSGLRRVIHKYCFGGHPH